MAETWFVVRDKDDGTALAPPRALLSEALEDKRGLPEGVRRDAEIGRVEGRPGRGALPEMARGAR